KNTNLIYGTLRDMVLSVISEVIDVVSNIVDLDISSYKILTRPENLDPKDDISLLEEMRNKVDGAIDTIVTYFSGEEGKNRLRSLIAKLVDEHAGAIGELQSFITTHFDYLAEKDVNIEFAQEHLAQDLIENSEISKVSQFDSGDHPECAPDEPYSDSEVKIRFENNKIEDVKNDISLNVTQAYEDVKNEELSVENNGENKKPMYIIGGLQNILDDIESDILDLLTSTIHGFGFIPMGCDLVKLFVDKIICGQEVVNTKFLQYTKMGVPYEFWEDDYDVAKKEKKILHETLVVDQKPDYLSTGEDIKIDISNPQGTHYTMIASSDDEYKIRPFETNWKVSLNGAVDIKTKTSKKLFLADGTHDYTRGNQTITIDIAITVTVYSGWGLEDVDYELSNTLLGDICAFLTQVWDYVVSVVGAVFDALSKLLESFMDLLTRLIGYISELVRLIMDTIQFLVELLKDFVNYIIDSIIKDIIEVIADAIGEGLCFTIFGFTFMIKGNKEVAMNQSLDGDLLSVTTKGNVIGADINFTVQFARYHGFEDGLSHYDILLDGTIIIGDFNLELAVDPLMKIRSYIVEGHGKSISENNTGWGIDFYAPFIEEYKEVKWSLSDFMGGLNSIPIPFLGLKATIDCGFVIQYNAPKGSDIVINEFELNPKDVADVINGTEWFEIFNPQGVDTGDWKIYSAHGGAMGWELSSLQSTNIGHYTVYNLPEDSLEDGEAGDPQSPGDGLILKDGNGNVKDRTPIFKDPGVGSDKTWQRSYDGGVIWKFKKSTRLVQNGPKKIDLRAEILDALKASFHVAWEELKEKEFNLDAVIEFVRSWIKNFIEMVLTLIADVVQKVYIFFDFLLEDVTGSGGGGIKLSLGMDDEGLVALLRWVVESIETFVYNICNPSNPKDYPSIPKTVPEHMFIRFELYLCVGTPKIIKRIAQEAPERCKLSIAIQANIPALVALLGWDWGDWEVVFGVFLSHFPSKAVSKLYGTSEDPNSFVDLWFFKARVYEIS
ncbi:MAG: hypothetical protein JSV56_08750, partial [Methanomassiliicoccales archaeon]